MARPLRIEYPGALYHVTNRGNERKPIFKDDTDRKEFLEILARSLAVYSIKLYSKAGAASVGATGPAVALASAMATKPVGMIAQLLFK